MIADIGYFFLIVHSFPFLNNVCRLMFIEFITLTIELTVQIDRQIDREIDR